MGISFITVEGIEGCGKSTQIELLRQELQRLGIPLLVTREPGGTALGERIRTILLHAPDGEICPQTELLLHLACRAQHVEEVIAPALASQRLVVCDRYSDSTLAYQGFGRGLDLGMIRQLNEIATKGLLPNLTIVYDVPVTEGMARAQERNRLQPPRDGDDRFERETLAFHERVRQGYLQLAAQEPERIWVIPAGLGVQEVWKATRACVAGKLGHRLLETAT